MGAEMGPAAAAGDMPFVVPRQSGCGEVICFEERCTRETETGEERLPGKSRHGWEQDAMVGNLPMPPTAVGTCRSCESGDAVGAQRRGFWSGLLEVEASWGFRITKQESRLGLIPRLVGQHKTP